MTDGVGESVLDAVAEAMRDVAASAILPRFRSLTDEDITLKGADDVVTAADVEAEALLAERLQVIRPGQLVLGEESSFSDPRLRERAEEAGTYWVVDPLDGTREFVAGRHGFGMMVALVESGTSTAAWIYLPTSDRLYDGSLGTPVRRNGERMPTPAGGPPPEIESTVGFALTRLAPPDVRAVVETNIRRFPTLADEESRSAASAYSNLLEGKLDFGFYWRTEPWDHVPGTFLLGIAGGWCGRLDGAPYAAGDDRTGLLVTTRKEQWPGVLETLYPSDSRM